VQDRILQAKSESFPSGFERTALRVTGAAFYLLAVGLAVTAVYNLFTAHKPETTLPGLIISLVSIAAMWLLVLWYKARMFFTSRWRWLKKKLRNVLTQIF
jgi:divalent metal cation (Fe/Co/Zn/Cd) transporter